MTADEVYRWLEQEIIVGALQPRERLLEVALCHQLKISRSLLREVFRRLEGGGLVRFSPNRGVAVRDFTPAEIENAYAVRLQLEHMAAPLIFERLTPKDLKDLREIAARFAGAVEAGDVREMVFSNRAFHEGLAAVSGNGFLEQLLRTAFLHTHQARHLAWANIQSGRQSVREHTGLLTALARRDLPGYVLAITRHLGRGTSDYRRVAAAPPAGIPRETARRRPSRAPHAKKES